MFAIQKMTVSLSLADSCIEHYSDPRYARLLEVLDV